MVFWENLKNKLCVKWFAFGKSRRDRKRKKFTMLIVPHNQAQAVKNISFPYWWLKLGSILGIIVLILVSTLILNYFSLTYLAVENKELREINTQQSKEIKDLKNRTGEMRHKLEGLMEIDREVRAKVGLSEEVVPNVQASRGEAGYLTDNFFWEERVKHFAGQDDQEELEDLKAELVKIDWQLTSQMRHMERLKSEVETRVNRPAQWPLRGYITSPFGMRKDPFDASREEFHNGLDIAGPYGAPIRAAGNGVVTFAGEKGNWGQMVLIAHGLGYVSLYAHNSSLLVEKNEQIVSGQIIARLGDTGRCTGPHLHFGIAKNGEWIDPLEILE